MSALPGGWTTCAISDLLEHTIGGVWGSPSGEDEVDVDVFRVTEFGPYGVLNPDTAARRSITKRQLMSRELRNGDVLLEKSGGGPTTPVGRVAGVVNPRREAVPTNFVQLLRPRTGLAHRFLLWLLVWEYTRGTTGQFQRATTNIRNLQTKDYLAHAVPLPPLGEQQRIVDSIEQHFSRLDSAAASLRRAENGLDSLYAKVTHEEMARAGGPLRRIGEIAEVQGGVQKQPKRKPRENRFPFLRVANVRRNELVLDEVHEIELFPGEIEKYRLHPGDLLVVEGNGSPEQIGRSAMWDGSIEPCVHQNHLIRVRPGPTLDARYLNWFWNSPSTARSLSEIASSTSGLYTLSTKKVREVEIPVPPLDVQRQVADQLDGTSETIRRLRNEVTRSHARAVGLRRAVLAAAFSGRLVRKDPTDEPASALLERIGAAPLAEKPSRKAKPQ